MCAGARPASRPGCVTGGRARAREAVPDRADRLAWLVLASASGVGPRTCGALVARFGRPSAVVRTPAHALAAVSGVGPSRAAALLRAFREADPEGLERDARERGLGLLTPADADYPAALAASPDGPAALWTRGLPFDASIPWVAVVGTRGATPYGLRIARRLSEDLARRGVGVVSGLARGIDAAAHAGALAGGGPTLAVLGCGVDVVYPPEHHALAGEVAASGALWSEHPPGTPPHPGHFPRRNRLVAAVSRVVVVVEAPLSSGALVTARLALDANHEVLAVPGSVERGTHAGCHRLIRDGATLCEGVADVLRALGLAAPTGDGHPADGGGRPALPPPPPGPALVVYGALDPDEARDGDDLARRTGLSPDAVAEAMTRLELDGHAVRIPGIGLVRGG